VSLPVRRLRKGVLDIAARKKFRGNLGEACRDKAGPGDARVKTGHHDSVHISKE
jgi:hypothetical protein